MRGKTQSERAACGRRYDYCSLPPDARSAVDAALAEYVADVDPDTGCADWTGPHRGRAGKRMPIIRLHGALFGTDRRYVYLSARKMLYQAQVSYQKLRAGSVAVLMCSNQACVRPHPRHAAWATPAAPLVGKKMPMHLRLQIVRRRRAESSLTLELVQQARAMRQAGARVVDICRELGAPEPAMKRALQGRSWIVHDAQHPSGLGAMALHLMTAAA